MIIAIRDELEDTKGSPKWLEELKDQLQEKGDGLKKRTLVMVTADALRKYGLKITELGSLEQAVQDVVRYSTQSPINTLLEIGDHLVVVFRETGALYLNRENDSGSIHFCPNFDRNAQVDTETFGIMPGKFTIMLAAIVRALYAKCKKTDGDNEKTDGDNEKTDGDNEKIDDDNGILRALSNWGWRPLIFISARDMKKTLNTRLRIPSMPWKSRLA